MGIKTIAICLLVVFAPLSVRGESERTRIISLTPGATEVLFALGLDEEIVGVSAACNFPEEAKAKEKVGQYGRPDIEKILYLKPDLILSIGLEGVPALAELKRLELNLVSFNPRTLNELLAAIDKIGKLTDKEKEACSLAAGMRKRISGVRERRELLPGGERPKVFVEIWHDPLITLGPDSFIDELLRVAGGSNIAYDLPRSYSRISAEVVIKRNPDFIVLAHRINEDKDAAAILSRRVGWRDITAVKRGRIISDIDPDILLRPSPRLVEGLEKLYERIHEE